MPRIKFNLQWSVSEDSTGGRELGQSSPGLWYGVNDQQDDGGTFSQQINASASNVLVPIFGLETATFLAIISDQTITISLNSTSNAPITLQPLGVGAPYAFWIGTLTDVTALYVSNPGSVNATVTFTIVGIYA
jgi:hypothetical protein